VQDRARSPKKDLSGALSDGRRGGFLLQVDRRLQRNSATQAASARVDGTCGTVDKGFDFLKIRVMADLGLDIRMTDLISNYRFLFAVSATSGHGNPLGSIKLSPSM